MQCNMVTIPTKKRQILTDGEDKDIDCYNISDNLPVHVNVDNKLITREKFSALGLLQINSTEKKQKQC